MAFAFNISLPFILKQKINVSFIYVSSVNTTALRIQKAVVDIVAVVFPLLGTDMCACLTPSTLRGLPP